MKRRVLGGCFSGADIMCSRRSFCHSSQANVKINFLGQKPDSTTKDTKITGTREVPDNHGSHRLQGFLNQEIGTQGSWIPAFLIRISVDLDRITESTEWVHAHEIHESHESKGSGLKTWRLFVCFVGKNNPL